MTDAAPHNIYAMNLALDAEETARAEVYALLSSLFYQPASKELLASIATGGGLCNDGSDTSFCRSWRALQQAAAQADAEAGQDGFGAAFIGTGRQPGMLYGAFYEAGFLREKTLAIFPEGLPKWRNRRRVDRHESGG